MRACRLKRDLRAHGEWLGRPDPRWVVISADRVVFVSGEHRPGALLKVMPTSETLLVTSVYGGGAYGVERAYGACAASYAKEGSEVLVVRQ